MGSIVGWDKGAAGLEALAKCKRGSSSPKTKQETPGMQNVVKKGKVRLFGSIDIDSKERMVVCWLKGRWTCQSGSSLLLVVTRSEAAGGSPGATTWASRRGGASCRWGGVVPGGPQGLVGRTAAIHSWLGFFKLRTE